MAQYGISIREILKRTVIVEAENLEEAIKKVEYAVEREEIVLDVGDYDNRDIVPIEYFEGGKVPDGEDISFYYHIGEDNERLDYRRKTMEEKYMFKGIGLEISGTKDRLEELVSYINYGDIEPSNVLADLISEIETALNLKP